MPQAFEEDVYATFPRLRASTGAYLFTLYPPVRPTGVRGRCPMFVMVGVSLFDVAGWTGNPIEGAIRAGGRFIGVELKETTEYAPSLAIRSPESKGSGIQAHQLEALAAVHRDGGLAYILWRNAGKVGRLRGEAIAAAFWDYGVSRAAEAAGKVVPRGSRSIPWALFEPVNDPELLDWLPLEDVK